jgi:hypothetical protein
VSQIDKLASKLSEKAYSGDVKPLNPRQKVTDEDLSKIFSAIEGKYYDLVVLKKELDGLIKVNDSNPSKSAISSTYLGRLSRFTKKRWRQKKAKDSKGSLLVKIYTDGPYVKRRRK